MDDIRHLILPAGIGLTHLQVYDQIAPDGLIGGSPHFHTCSSEIYCVLAGRGNVELLWSGGYRKIALEPKKVVYFRPGVIHRLENPDSKLEILVIMQNGGLPERGDFVLTFPEAVLKDPEAYKLAAQAADVPSAIRRRDLAVQGFEPLKTAMIGNPTSARAMLKNLYQRAGKLLAPKADEFSRVLQAGALAEAGQVEKAVSMLKTGPLNYLEDTAWGEIDAMNSPTKAGMCGILHPYSIIPAEKAVSN